MSSQPSAAKQSARERMTNKGEKMADKTYIGVKEAQAIDACLAAGLDVQITRTSFGVKIVGVEAKKVFRSGEPKSK